MQVCKLFLKILKKNVFIFILYFSIFTLISIFMIKGQTNYLESQDQKILVSIAIEEENQDIRDFITFLDLYVERKELKQGEKVEDALFWDEIDLYMEIPKDLYDFIEKEEEGIKVISSPDSLNTKTLLNAMTSYFNTLKESVRLNLCKKEEAFSYTTKLFIEKESAHIELLKKDSTAGVRGVYDMAIYVVCALILSIVGIVSFEIRTLDINRRLRISSYSTGKRNLMLAICYMLFSLVFVGIITCIAMGLFPNQINSRLLLYSMNICFFALITVTMALFFSSLFKSDMAYSCLANVLPLATAFLCGCFIGIDLLPSATKAFAHIFPQLYIVMANQYIQTTSQFSFLEYVNIIWPCFLFILLFLVGSILVTNRMAKSEN